MTAQISDFLILEGSEYNISAIQNKWPFDPKEHGFNPVSPHTACWRGYYCKYIVQDKELYLCSLNVSIGEGNPVGWAGAMPQESEFFKYDRMWEYKPKGYKVPYTGGIVIARDFIREFYVHMGFHRPHCYAIVKELIFRNGYLENETDHSEKMKFVRDSLRSAANKSDTQTPTIEEIERYVNAAFSLSYENKWT
ncbi:MAG: hypothetical protein BWK80_57965 [Desulfobacteraceae bacterium IS3]|nr:MAG: hypothetical protein BWK80_57965 [Desulfobacteraceae bacterium IS3]